MKIDKSKMLGVLGMALTMGTMVVNMFQSKDQEARIAEKAAEIVSKRQQNN